MEQIISLQKGWKVLQDVHDIGEKTGLYRQYESSTDSFSMQISLISGGNCGILIRRHGGTVWNLTFPEKITRVCSYDLRMWIIMQRYG